MNATTQQASQEQAVPEQATPEPTPLVLPLPVEELRFGGEAIYAAALCQVLGLTAGATVPVPDPHRIRRALMARSLLLSEGMAPAVYSAARAGAVRFGIESSIEVFQSAGAENAAMHLVEQPVLLEIQGRLLSLLDPGALNVVVGHELGHFLAHGPQSPHAKAAMLVGPVLRGAESPPAAEGPAQRLSMAMELTADRFGLLAIGDLAAALRLEMVTVTGLAADSLTWDTQAYLDQSRTLMEATLAEGDTAQGFTHPEHSLRAYALWLFSESDLYRRLTGQGPGHRPIAEVDRQLLQILGRPEVELGAADILDEPPTEVHACALAACVLIAAADGHLHDSEMAAIERVFASLVADWRSLLDPEEALATFQRLGPLIATAGPRLQRSLFTLLVHVLAVDGEIHEDELATLLAIGGALGCRRLFTDLLPPVLAQFGIAVEAVTARPPRSIPMPPRTGETAAALGVYLTGVAARGGDRVTLRRLLRLLGERRATPTLLAQLTTAMDGVGLLAEPPFGEDLDAPHRLALTPAAEAASQAAAATRLPTGTGSTVQRLTSGLTRLRDKLISGDGRSPAIRLYGPRSGRALDVCLLEEVSPGLAERTLVLVRAGKRALLVEGAEAGGHEGAQRLAAEVIALDREHRARVEESGASDLFLGYPFLTGLAGGYLVRGPLILHPLAIERGGARGAGITLIPTRDEPPIANQSLLRLIFSHKGLSYGDTLAERLDALAAEGHLAVSTALAEQGVVTVAAEEALVPFRNRGPELAEWRDDRLEIEECAVLGLFPQSSSDLLQDYDGLLAELAAGASPSQLLGSARELLPADLREAIPPAETPAASAGTAEPDPVPVVYSDPSQRAVLACARTARALVVDGPPGTGKSQVIVNLVADALARGERVAVVCEKRAALDVVVNRLGTQGLRHLLAVVHDVQEDRRGLYRQVVARLEDETERPAPGPELAKAAQEAATLGAQIQRRTEALAQRHQGLALGELHTYAAGLEVQADGHQSALADLDPVTLEELATAIASLQPFADLWQSTSPWVHHEVSRPSLANLDPHALEQIGTGFAAAVEDARQFEALSTDLGLAPTAAGLATIARARVALQTVAQSRDSRSDPESQAAFIAFLARALEGEAALAPIAAAEAAWREGADAALAVGQPVRFPDDQETAVALAAASRLHGSLFRFFKPSWRRANKTLRATLAAHWPERTATPLDGTLIAAVQERLAAARVWRALEAVAPLVGPRVKPPVTAAEARDWLAGLGGVWRQVQPLASLRPTLEAAGAWPEALVVPALETWDQQVDGRLELLRRRARMEESVKPLTEIVPWTGDWPRAESLAEMAHAWQRDHPRLAESDRLLARTHGHFPHASQLLRRLADRFGDGTHDWAETVRKGWALACIARLETANTDTRHLDQLTAEEASRTGRRLDQVLSRHAHLSAAELLALQDRHPLLTAPQPGKGQRRSTEQAAREALLKEAKKQRNILHLRRFVRRFGEDGLLDLLPVWLLSPQTMAVLFPRKPLFDLVVIDEASQCTVENGLAVLLRGRRVVIAGDERQMPPTNFFRAGEVTAEEDEEDDERRERREMFDAESLLVLARGRVPHAGLEWHYRCLHEELIAFSNHAIYGGTLKTIPSTASRTATPALRWVHVPDGAYQDGANPAEAARVVDLMGEVLQRPDRPSLGVVTFNLSQRRAILDEIDRRRATDPSFAAAYDTAMTREPIDERPFIKNLESVQGDERDLILFSLGHAPQERSRRDGRVERYVPARFGPLGQKGGERRLNVAVSRAKREILVVASFDPVLLSVARSKNEGPKLFKQFLEYAHHLANGRRNQAERVLALARGVQPERLTHEPDRHPVGYVPLKVQIALALEQRGLHCELDVGTSGHRIPLAVLNADDAGHYRLGILCDEGEQAPSPLESHVHVPRVLDARSWRFLYVDGREWERRREAVLKRIDAALAVH